MNCLCSPLAIWLIALAGAVESAAAVPQDPGGGPRPRLLEVGPLPDAPVVLVSVAGVCTRPTGEAFDPKAAEPMPTVVLRAPGACAARHIDAVLAGLEGRGCREIVFEVERRSDGAIGGFALALGSRNAIAARAAPIQVELHRRRPGVPPASLQAPLRRVIGAMGEAEVTVGVLAPHNATLATVLDVLAAVDGAGAQRLRVAWDGDEASGDGSFALDLGPMPRIPVVASTAPPVAAAAVGFAEPPADAASGRRGPGGGAAGGRFAGRRLPPAPECVERIVQFAGTACQRLRAAAFSECHLPPAAPDVEAAALTVLGLLAAGEIPRGTATGALDSALGVILSAQISESGLAAFDPWTHAVAAWAMVEAYGLGRKPPVLRVMVRGALESLSARHGDAGADGALTAARNHIPATALALIAIRSARLFEIEVPMPPGALAALRAARRPDGAIARADPALALAATAWTDLALAFSGESAADGNTRLAEVVAKVLADEEGSVPLDACWAVTLALVQQRDATWERWVETVAARLDSEPVANLGVRELALQLAVARRIAVSFGR